MFPKHYLPNQRVGIVSIVKLSATHEIPPQSITEACLSDSYLTSLLE